MNKTTCILVFKGKPAEIMAQIAELIRVTGATR